MILTPEAAAGRFAPIRVPQLTGPSGLFGLGSGAVDDTICRLVRPPVVHGKSIRRGRLSQRQVDRVFVEQLLYHFAFFAKHPELIDADARITSPVLIYSHMGIAYTLQRLVQVVRQSMRIKPLVTVYLLRMHGVLVYINFIIVHIGIHPVGAIGTDLNLIVVGVGALSTPLGSREW